MKPIAALCVTLALAGCASSPEVITRTIEVKVPVSVPCKAPAVERPQFAFDRVSKNDDVYVKGRALLVERKQRQSYEQSLEAALAACQ